MADRKAELGQNFFVDDTLCDVSGASLSIGLSAADLDQSGDYFYITVDRALFETPVAVISKVLEANGYAVNLENLLASFDFLKMGGSRHRWSQETRGGPSASKGDATLPCFQAAFPEPAGCALATLLRRNCDL